MYILSLLNSILKGDTEMENQLNKIKVINNDLLLVQCSHHVIRSLTIPHMMEWCDMYTIKKQHTEGDKTQKFPLDFMMKME